jgi:hypothetical protein
MATIHVELLQEGTRVWRPVEATQVTSDLYELQGSVPTDEIWAFQPGDVVRCRWHTFGDGQRALVADELIPGPKRG